jgi:diguanylate cyclase (GGDEF)-like protein
MATLRAESVIEYFKRPIGLAVLFSIAVILAYSIWVLFFPYDPHDERIVSSLAIILLAFIFTGFSFHLSRQKQFDTRQRRSWLILSLAIASWAIGECVWFYYESILGVRPTPSLADFFFLLFWGLSFVGVISFPFHPISNKEKILLWLDLSIVMTTGFIVVWYFVMASIQFDSESLINSVTIIYPVAALLVFAAVIGLIQRDSKQVARKVLLCLAAGMLCNISVGVFFAYFEIHQNTYYNVYLNILWLVSLLCMLIAVSLHTKWDLALDVIIQRGNPTPPLLLRRILPYIAIAIALALLVFSVTSGPIPKHQLYVVLYGALILVGLVSLRQHFLLRENLRLYQEMERLAITDSLTGIFNRYFVNEMLRRETERTKRHQQPFAVLLIDVDGFKKYNDTFGHLQGDVALKTIARLLQSEIRSSDILGRFGGDEFVAILYESEREGAERVVEKMKKAIKNADFGTKSLGVTIGMAIFRAAMTADQLLQEADQDLYLQKSNVVKY